MSADNQIVVAFHRTPEMTWRSTAAVVQNPSDLMSWTSSFDKAKAQFLDSPNIWFEGKDAFYRAKTLARLLAWEYRANGWILETEDVLFIKIFSEDKRISILTSERLY